jgi:hypothetical protein
MLQEPRPARPIWQVVQDVSACELLDVWEAVAIRTGGGGEEQFRSPKKHTPKNKKGSFDL